MYGFDSVVARLQSSKGALFILCGYPYSGKSYVAYQLQKETDVSSVSIDRIFYEHGFDWDTNVLPGADEWGSIFNESYERIREKLMDDMNVLYDSTNHTAESREALRAIADSVGSETSVVYVATTEDSVWKRWRESAEQQSRPLIPKELVMETIEAFEEPTEEENTLIIQN